MMKIARHIAYLLYDNECVVVPGLGGFITKEHHAVIHPIKHQFKPPFREIVFNPNLLNNDGVLINRIARAENINYHDARNLVDLFVSQCLDDLAKNKPVDLDGIGVLSPNPDGELVFEQDSNYNYLGSSFGLTAFVSPAIIRDDFNLKLKRASTTKSQNRVVNNKNRSSFRRSLAISATILLLLGLVWGLMNPQLIGHYYRSYAGLVPFFYSSPNEYIASNLDQFSVNEILAPNNNAVELDSPPAEHTEPQYNVIDLNDNQQEVINTEPDEGFGLDSDTEPLQPETNTGEAFYAELADNPVPSESPARALPDRTEPLRDMDVPHICQESKDSQARYYIIAGAFREIDNADNLAEQLQSKGFKVGCAGQTNGGLWRISYEATNSWSVALERLAIIRNQEDPNAWLFSAK